MSRCRSFLPDLMTVRAVMVRAAMEKKKHRPQHRGKGKGKSPDKGNKKGPGKGKGKEKGKEARSSTPPPAVFAPPAQGKGKK